MYVFNIFSECIYVCTVLYCIYVCRNKSSMKVVFLSCYRDNMYVCTVRTYIHTYIYYIYY